MYHHRVDFHSAEWHSPVLGVRFKVYKWGGSQLRLAEFSKAFVEAEWCTRGHIGYVLEGQMEIDFDGHVETFSAGDGIFIPPGEEHKHKAIVLTDFVRLILVESG